jgi:hypothetical protein
MKDIRRMSLLALMTVLLFAFNGCGDDGNDVKSHLNEHDFTQNPSLVATTDDLVIINLEHPHATDVHEHDSHVSGIDRIPLHFPEDVSHEFVVEHKEKGDAYFVVLLDEANNEILRVDRWNNTVIENITAGTYTLEIHHGSGIDGAYTLFVRPGSTYTGGDCPGCNLHEANLSGADLSNANLDYANLASADLSHADLTNARLTRSDLTYANLTGANLTGANLALAFLFYANLTGANLTGVDLTEATLDCAIWIDGTTCGVWSTFDGATCVGGSTDKCL